jgi:hypothetical protein
MMNLMRVGLAVFVVVILAGPLLGQSQKQATVPQVPQKQPTMPQVSQKQIQELKSQIAVLQDKVAASEAKASDLELRLIYLELAKSDYQSVSLDLTARSYLRLDTDTGLFLVSVQDASPYLDGYRITLNVGNPSFATYNGFKFKVKWNTKYDWTNYSAESYAKWRKANREKEVSFINSLGPGKWNKVELLLPSTSGDQLGYFQLSMETNTVSLYIDK